MVSSCSLTDWKHMYIQIARNHCDRMQQKWHTNEAVRTNADNHCDNANDWTGKRPLETETKGKVEQISARSEANLVVMLANSRIDKSVIYAFNLFRKH